ncbi:MAG: EAL domain-containing protein [Phycisphaeraceae bacterium]|nr:EAL domain-containing protein [Phycisphaeraceae bacterium]
MAAKVSLINIGKDLWSYLCRQIPPPVALSNYTSETQLSEALKSGNLDADIIVLGHHLEDPLKIANWVKAVSPYTKIFVLRRPSDFELMRQNFQNNPTLGDGIFLCSTADIKSLPAALINSTVQSANDTNINATLSSSDKIPVLNKKAVLTQPEEIEVVDDLLNSANVGFILLDKNQTITHANEVACGLLNMDAHESLGTPIDLILSNHEQSTVKQLITEAQDNEKKSTGLITVETDNSTLHLRCTVALNDKTNTLSGFALIIQDQSNLMRIEAELLEEQTRNKLTLELLKEGVIITDDSLDVIHMNPVAESLTGWPTFEAEGHNIEEIIRLIDSDNRERFDIPGYNAIQENRTIHVSQNLLLVNNNDERAIEISIAPHLSLENKAQGAVIIIKDLSETRRLTNEIQHHASHDSLTGLLNRQEFEYQVEKSIASAAMHDVQHVLCYIDVNQFKIINAQAGHTAGDFILKEVAHLLRSRIRSIDYIGRLGGDEFALLMVNHTLDNAKRTSQSLIEEFQRHRFTWENQTFELGLSIGVVPVTKESPESAQMLTRAELTCFSAKERGRNQVHVYQADDDELTHKHAEILRAAGITGALQEDRFMLYCQPIVSLSLGNRSIQHYELLLRLNDTNGNIIMPGSFIPAAERYGLMPNVDRWVIHTALHSYHETFGEKSGVHIAINLSGNSLSDDKLLGFIKDELASSEVDPQHVCFEITETAAINNLSQASHLIKELKTVGCCFALDDFGSGLSSFTYLKNLPVDYLKIDGSFVTDMSKDTVDYAMVEAINQLGHVLGIGTIAECAESEEVVEQLRKLGVDFAQGYAMGSPMPMDGLKLLH